MSKEPKPKETRPLTEEERKMIEKRVAEDKNEMQSMMFAKHQAELMLSEGIEADMYENKRKFKKQLSMVEQKIKEITFNMEVSEKQLNEGVDVTPKEDLPDTIVVSIPEEHNYYDIIDKLEDMGLVVQDKEINKGE